MRQHGLFIKQSVFGARVVDQRIRFNPQHCTISSGSIGSNSQALLGMAQEQKQVKLRNGKKDDNCQVTPGRWEKKLLHLVSV